MAADVIRVDCDLEGCEGLHVDFKRGGWKFKHLRLWEEARSSSEAARVVSERIANWNLRSGDQPVKFVEGVAAFDELDPVVVRWIVGIAFLEAYNQAGQPDPNGL